jgi:hypothetical protein
MHSLPHNIAEIGAELALQLVVPVAPASLALGLVALPGKIRLDRICLTRWHPWAPLLQYSPHASLLAEPLRA